MQRGFRGTLRQLRGFGCPTRIPAPAAGHNHWRPPKSEPAAANPLVPPRRGGAPTQSVP